MKSHYPCSNRTSNTDSMIIHYMRVERKGGGGRRREASWLRSYTDCTEVTLGD